MFKHQSPFAPLTLFLALAVMASAAPAEDAAHARVSYDGGGAMIKGAQDGDWSYATNNTLVLTNDTVWVDKGGTLEMEMAGGTFLRMADRSKAEILSLPPATAIRLITGSYYIQRTSRSTGAFTLRTPACSAEVQADSMVRVDVLDSGSTTVSVHWGKATVHTDVGSPVVVNADRQIFVDPGYLPSKPAPFIPDRDDDFDVWNRDRAKALAGVNTDIAPMRSVISEAPMGAYDLAPYGQWVTVENEPYWQPTVVADYVPYREGHWSYMPCYGYVWVGDYPFSYITTHYGRWTYRDHYGWLWCYQNQWAPAWVASVRCGSDFLWCPLDPFNRPVCYDANYLTIGGVRFSLAACTYCPADALFLGYAPVFACAPDYGHHFSPADFFLWDLYARGRNPGRSPFTIPNLPTRDYSPRRVIRGPDTLGPRGVLAGQRITALETTQTIAMREGSAISGHRGQRTSTEQGIREARARTATLDRGMLSSTTQLGSRFGRTTTRTDATTPRNTTLTSSPGTSAPSPTTRERLQTTPRNAEAKPLREATAPATVAPRITAGGPRMETTRRTETSRVVHLTNPSSARPPDAGRPASVWPDKPLREDGGAVPTPQRTPARTRIAEEQDSVLRAPSSTPRYDGSVTNRTRSELRAPSVESSGPRDSVPSIPTDRTPALRHDTSSQNSDTPSFQRFDRSPGQQEATVAPRFDRSTTPRIENSAPQRVESAPQRVESAPREMDRSSAPRFEAPAQRFEAPRFSAPESRHESARSAPSYTPPSPSSNSTDSALRGPGSDTNRDSSRLGRGR